MDTENNSGTDIDVLTNFQPMPKRFIVWDKYNAEFLRIEHAYPKCQISNDERNSIIFSLQDLTALFDGVLYYDNSDDYVVCQSTNLFDKDGKEMEGKYCGASDRRAITCEDYAGHVYQIKEYWEAE